jgi:signal transduction histidine kinase
VWSADVDRDPPPGYADIHATTGTPLGDAFRTAAFRAVLAVPMVSRDAVLGAVVVLWDDVHEPDARETRLLTALARQAGIAMDNARLVEDMRRALEELKAAQDTLVRGATLRAVGELAAGAAHHLNNLLAVVLGRTQLLLMKSPPAEMVQSLKTIERSAVDAADTVRRIQAFSTTDRGPEAAPLELNAVIQDALQLTRSRWEHEAQLRGARVEVVFVPGAVPPVHGRAADIREAIANLVLNAVDAMPAGGRLSIRSWREDARAVVAVTDTGTGMPEDVRRRAFEPFFTTKGVKRTGLGLPVVYGAIRRHGGEITMDSTEGRGTTVTFWLPIGTPATAAEPAAAQGPAAPETAAATPAGPRPAAILVIDDEAPVRQLVAEVLRSRGHSVTAASSGREGLERFRVGRFDLVITDLGMPDITGWDVARAVRGTSPTLPVLVLTGWADAVEPPPDVGIAGILTLQPAK